MTKASRILEVAIAGLLLYSGLQHSANPYLFAGAVAAYDVAPPWLLVIVPFVLPHLMIVASLCLLTGNFAFTARCLSVVLFSVFAISQFWVWVNGTSISCGCFGHSLEPISIRSISVPVLCGLGVSGVLLLDSRRGKQWRVRRCSAPPLS